MIEQIILLENKINKLNSEDFGKLNIIISKADQLIVDYNLYVEELLSENITKIKKLMRIQMIKIASKVSINFKDQYIKINKTKEAKMMKCFYLKN